MNRSNSASKAPNERNLIFDEWITSRAHPTLTAHSLIPSNIVDDDKAVQDMLAEAMNEEHFSNIPSLFEDVRSPTPASGIEVPVTRAVEVTTRPRSSSSLSMRKWAGIFVGRGEPVRRPGSSASSKPSCTQTTQQRSSSAPDTDASVGNQNLSTASVDKGLLASAVADIEPPMKAGGIIHTPTLSSSSSSTSIPAINIVSPARSKPLSPPEPDLHRCESAPAPATPTTLDQMRSEAIKSINTLRSPTRLRATTLTAPDQQVRSRSGSDSTVPKPVALSQSSSSTSLTSLSLRSPPVGIVEMEMIIPPEHQPPSQHAKWDDHYHSEDSGLTDRYGFIVGGGTTRREHGEVLDLRESLRERTRSDEERWRNVASETEDRIEELRKLGAREKRMTAPFMGWSPSSKEESVQPPLTTGDTKIPSPTSEMKPTSPLANEILPNEQESSAPVHIPDISPLTPSLSIPTPPIPTLSTNGDLTTIKLLLSKLNDLHDSLDRANRQRWDKWLSQSDPTDSLLSQPPNPKDRKQRLRDFKSLVMGGIPVKYRSKIWNECSGAQELFRPGYFEELAGQGRAGLEGGCVQQIEMDIHRTMPNNVFFGGNGPGIAKLERVLIAFARHNPGIGYCQGSMILQDLDGRLM